jgi:3-deoxy-D-manno-octulosonic-acid transferase
MTAKARPKPSGKPPVRPPDVNTGGAAAGVLRALYNLSWYPALPVALLIGGRDATARHQRLGRVDSLPAHAAALRVWLHASSVGEIEAVRPIALGLLESQPGVVLVVTTMTETGREAAMRRIPAAAAYRLAPLDHRAAVRAHLASVAPGLVLIAEAELWPNYFIESRRFGARVAIVNGRLSARSLKRYRLMRPLWRAALNCVDVILAQSRADADRYIALGAPAQRIVVTGNTKFGTVEASGAEVHPALARFAAQRATLIAGSTAPREEEQVLEAYVKLRAEFPGLRLVLAPRHLERVGEIVELLDSKRLDYVKASALKSGAGPPATAGILLLDTLGDLRLLYRCGTLAFVGGSLFDGRGGQNLGEPAAAGVAVLFGPFHQNQQETAQALLANAAGAVVSNAQDLAHVASRLLHDESARREAGARARQVYESLAGGAARSLEHLRALIGSR